MESFDHLLSCALTTNFEHITNHTFHLHRVLSNENMKRKLFKKMLGLTVKSVEDLFTKHGKSEWIPDEDDVAANNREWLFNVSSDSISKPR